MIELCCQINLRKCGLIMGYSSIIGGCVSMLTSIGNPTNSLTSDLIFIVTGALCLYGIYKEKPVYMLPYIVSLWFASVICLFFAFYIPIDWYGSKSLCDMIIGNFPLNEMEKQKMTDVLDTVYVVMFISFVFLAVLGIYFALIMQFLYKSINVNVLELPITQPPNKA